jgi:hypothetical protein
MDVVKKIENFTLLPPSAAPAAVQNSYYCCTNPKVFVPARSIYRRD